MSSINEEPNRNITNLNSGSKRSGIFGVACSDTAPPFEKQESILNERSELVEILVIFPQMFTFFLGGMTGIIPSSTALRMIAAYHSPDPLEGILPESPQSADRQLCNPLWYQK